MSSSLYAKKKLEMNDNHLQILSNGRYRSIEHRAVVHPSKERMSRIPDFDRTENLIHSRLHSVIHRDGAANLIHWNTKLLMYTSTQDSPTLDNCIQIAN